MGYQGRGGLRWPRTTMRRAPNWRRRRGSLYSLPADHHRRATLLLIRRAYPCRRWFAGADTCSRGHRSRCRYLRLDPGRRCARLSHSRARLPPGHRSPKPTPTTTPLAPPCRIKTIKQQTVASKPRSKNCHQKEKKRETRKGDEEEAKRACFPHKLAVAGRRPLQLARHHLARRVHPPANSACSAALRSPTAARSSAPSSCRVSSSTPSAVRRSSSVGRHRHCFD
uniref:Uncharacterized protein n=1 Tax=Oryza punctata TaxID=4537 RepID=A0A0E0K8M0_ORYPU